MTPACGDAGGDVVCVHTVRLRQCLIDGRFLLEKLGFRHCQAQYSNDLLAFWESSKAQLTYAMCKV